MKWKTLWQVLKFLAEHQDEVVTVVKSVKSRKDAKQQAGGEK